jgi:hypothetical protein
MRRHVHFRGAALLALLAAAGCSGGAPRVSGSTEEATVHGTVRVRGKPVTNGRMYFKVSNVNRPTAANREAAIGADGSYAVKTLVGQNSVEVECKELLAPQNRVYKESERGVFVNSGDNAIDIDIGAPDDETAKRVPGRSKARRPVK